MRRRGRGSVRLLSGGFCFSNLVIGFVLMVRGGFYAENLLSYAHQAKEEGVLPLPIGQQHKFAPVALGVSLPFFMCDNS